MIYKYKTEGKNLKDFRSYQNPIELFKSLKGGCVNPGELLKNQINFKSDLGRIRKGNPDFKSKEQTSVIQNVNNFFDLRENIIDFFRDYSFLLSEAKYNAKHGKGLKILSPKQTLLRLPTVLAQVKANNTSKNLLHKTCQIIYSLYWAKEITKKAYNNIITSIKL